MAYAYEQASRLHEPHLRSRERSGIRRDSPGGMISPNVLAVFACLVNALPAEVRTNRHPSGLRTYQICSITSSLPVSSGNCLASRCGLVAISIPFRTSLPLFRFSPPLVHSHHHPRRWVLPIQLRRFRNQFLDARPLHFGNAPQFHVSHAFPRSLQQLLRVR